MHSISLKKKASTFLLALLLMSQSISAQPDNYAPYEGADCCQEPSSCCWDSKAALTIGGAVILGAVAGAIAGRSNHRHHHCSSSSSDCFSSSSSSCCVPGPRGATGATGAMGATGATGPSFAYDIGESLTFYFELPDDTLNAQLEPTSVFFTPFVTGPDGVTIEGKTEEVSFPFSYYSFEPFDVENPAFGQYEAGLRSDTAEYVYTDFFVEVFASRDGSTTGLGTGSIAVTSFVNPEAPPQTQLQGSLPFTYDNETIP